MKEQGGRRTLDLERSGTIFHLITPKVDTANRASVGLAAVSLSNWLWFVASNKGDSVNYG
ncbi:hypothetical protein KDW_17510 [Dictyobacter vulcani]|uniref:Uncharacterized protein n=1 Tax=Dictyobacter vulcani TaxID=2607529 RepID=A0A5J4KN76_9CHLR|nr:hypothetical protein KDW_17510 [Dictyobacter vulcani]